MSVSKIFGFNNFVGLPPDSTGKNLLTNTVHLVEYGSGTNDFYLGDTVVGETSNTTGVVIRVDGTTSTGQLAIHLDHDSVGTSYITGENLQVASVTHAVVGQTAIDNVQSINLVGGNNPLHIMSVSERGSAFVRFSEGEQQMDATGSSRSTTPSQLQEYTHYYNELPNAYYDDVVGGASVTYLPNESSVALDVTSANGDRLTRTSHVSHIYQAGFSQLINMTVSCGDSGKTNVDRRWGYFDDNDGLFFELTDTTVNVVLRSFVTGSVVETRIPQSSWNGDVLDGTGGPNNLSQDTLNVVDLTLYWIDFLWLGAGRIRFGIYDNNGDRITVHTMIVNDSSPFMSVPTLPVRFEIENTGASASPSRLKVVCAAVIMEGDLVDARSKRSVKWSISQTSGTSVGATVLPLISFRPKTTINSKKNRKVSIPELVAAYVTDAPCLLSIYRGATLTSPSWSSVSTNSAAEYDESATALSDGQLIASWALDAGSHNLDLPQNFGLFSENIHLQADDGQDISYTFAASSLTGSNSTVRVFPTWIDI